MQATNIMFHPNFIEVYDGEHQTEILLRDLIWNAPLIYV